MTDLQLIDNPLWKYRFEFSAVLFGFIAIETVFRFLRFRKGMDVRAIYANSVILGVEMLLRVVSFGVRMAAACWVYSLSPFRWEWNWSSSLVLYVLIDFIYYWRHRLLHQTRLGWAVHSTHHSSQEMTILATFRLSWLEASIRDFFYMPLLLLGFEPMQWLFLVELNAASQFWCHTDTIGPLRWLDGWLNTPWNHRIHHSVESQHIHANYGSTLMLWDKWFGTYLEGRDGLKYGVEGVKNSFNPLFLELGLFWKLLRRKA